MFENVDRLTTDVGAIGLLIAHLGAFRSGELITGMSPVFQYAVVPFLSLPPLGMGYVT